MENKSQGIFINGKAQIVEMLQYMTAPEREKLLKNIKARNSQLADELMQESVSFSDFLRLDDRDIQLVLNYIKAPILGVALKALKREDQRQILVICDRAYAEEAYKVMSTPLSNEARDVKRACDKVSSVISALVKRGNISLF
ncbi:FliG C-terminal domain-containing protein [Bacteriovoracaceae bacterium]|nr:FliG C-terminal domain-containing protein [Bacteriovoracaceae bacterium]|tara:strand:- start:3756 stop:4181 length:426 start_codon:yes stop_codon:yes gene_type:complete